MIVETASGRVEGTEGGGVRVFRGIPFAAAPTGDRRLRPPQPAEPWTGIREATAFGAWAPQLPPASPLTGELDGETAEDCLTLNVWTPGMDATPRPVMVWVHGGGFTSGSGAMPLYSGERLAAAGDVVVVTINYRLGILGFLAHPDLTDEESGAAGNWGLLDQVAALRWIRDNIGAFGGDPAAVTIFGESAGSMSVADLLALPAAAGLFHRAICQSGPPRALDMGRAEAATAKLLAEVGVGRPADLRRLPMERLLQAQGAMLAGPGGGMLRLAPVVDGAALPRPPDEALADGASADVPLVIGSNRDEWKLFIAGDPAGRDPDEDTVRRRIESAFRADGIPLVAAEVIDAYRAIRAAQDRPTGPRELWSAIESDRVFRVGSVRAAEDHARYQADTYMYLFDWESPALRGALGAAHGVEIPFVFDALDQPRQDRFAGAGPEAEALAGQMQDAWSTFARTGRPGAGWPRYEAGSRATMIWGRTSGPVDAPLEDERRIWDRRPGSVDTEV
jgi:para-nitrobenzyl esterase